MASLDEQILRATKEIVVKFIEAGRISPTGFHEAFKSIYATVEASAKKNGTQGTPQNTAGSAPDSR